MSKYFEPFIFENLPAKDRVPNKAYIKEVEQSDIYIALIGKEIGSELKDGSTPTIQEFNAATKKRKIRLIFILEAKKEERHAKINKLIESLSSSLIYGHFTAIADLISNVYSSLISFLIY